MNRPWCSLLLFLTSGLPVRAQEPIRVAVNIVNAGFTVRDARGALVDNLTQGDVQIFEDAVEQKIAFFARSADVPLTLGLIVDVSGSQKHFSKKHEHDLEVFLREVLGPKDRVFLVCFGNHIRLVSDLSQSPRETLERLKRFEHDKERFPELGPTENRDLGTAFYDSIYYSANEKLAGGTGRQGLLVFSDGEDNSSSHDMMSTIEAAQNANVLVYTIRYTEKEHGKLTARNKYGISVMDRIAKETGGAHIDAEITDPHTYFREIAEELRTSYEAAYYPSNTQRDDTFRKIVIRTKREGLQVRAKTGYFAR
ncbi:MAG TPA: VWA domain-containing protein [Candidatus Dormibacteraeota bacterium]|nr:VWA domain-containing protein [Candidatus Dormibacteraeota bacterium]